MTARRLDIGQRIRAARRAAGLRQEPLAHLCGLDRRTIQRVEAGLSDVRLSWLIVIAHHLGVPLDELVRVPGPPQ